MSDAVKGHGLRQFEIVQYINGPLEGELNDWPASIQDAVFKALEDKSKQVELPLTVVLSYCGIDHDAEVENRPQEKFYLHIVASEVVMADDRTIDPRRLM